MPDDAARAPSLRDRAVEELRRRGTASRAELARALGTSRSTMGAAVADLIAEGIAVELPDRLTSTTPRPDAGPPRLGRPGTQVALDPRLGAAVGIDVGHRHVHGVVCDLAHAVLAEERRELPQGHDAEQGIAAAAELLDALLDRAAVPSERVVGVGVGLPGPLDRASGTVTPSSASMGWVGVPVAELLQARVGHRVLLDNDANLGVRAELLWGAGRGARDLVYVKLATGVGAGIVAGGQVLRGTSGAAGELGHVTVDETGALCRCGHRGCLEGVIGASRLLELLRPLHGELTVEQLCAYALGGDRASRRVVADAARALGGVLASLVSLLNPELVLLGGELSGLGDLLLDPVREAVARGAVPAAAAQVRVVAAELGPRAEALGAVALVLQETDRYVALPASRSLPGG